MKQRRFGDPPLVSNRAAALIGVVVLPVHIGALVLLDGWLSYLLVLGAFAGFWAVLVVLVRRERMRRSRSANRNASRPRRDWR